LIGIQRWRDGPVTSTSRSLWAQTLTKSGHRSSCSHLPTVPGDPPGLSPSSLLRSLFHLSAVTYCSPASPRSSPCGACRCYGSEGRRICGATGGGGSALEACPSRPGDGAGSRLLLRAPVRLASVGLPRSTRVRALPGAMAHRHGHTPAMAAAGAGRGWPPARAGSGGGWRRRAQRGCGRAPGVVSARRPTAVCWHRCPRGRGTRAVPDVSTNRHGRRPW
jgi:hypothetical protein